MAVTEKKVKVSTEKSLAAPKEGVTARFSGAKDSAIWLNVFDKLDPQDKLTFSRADTEWHDLVDSKRTQFLIPEVAPTILELLTLKQLLQSRELCKLWSLEWDHQAVTHPSNLSLELEKVASKMPYIPNYITVFNKAAEIQEFLQDMKNHPGNPFPGRKIRLQCSPTTNEDKAHLQHEYDKSVILLLKKFGKHVHYSTIILSRSYGNRWDNKTFLRKSLLHLPHLRRLDIFDYETDVENNGEVGEFYLQNPLPLLENLETLHFRYVGTAMVNSILETCCLVPAIKRLHLESLSEYNLGQIDAVYKFRNLEVLSAPLFIRDLERFSSQREFPPLRELSLQWMKRPNFQCLLNALEPFGNTLQSLKMDSIFVASGHHVEPRSIDFPNLRELSIGYYKGPLDPLVQLTALTNINIDTFNFKRSHPSRQMLHLYELEDQMKKSNIWEHIPALKTFWLHFKTFYRRDVENQVACKGKTSK